ACACPARRDAQGQLSTRPAVCPARVPGGRIMLEREVETALRAARAAAELVAAVYDRGFAVDWKGQDDPVTEADRRANELLVSTLRREFPSDAVCAEESDLMESAREAARGGRCWFVDPLDGTREFIRRS